MNKYFWIAIVGVLIIGGGIIYRVAFLKSEDKPLTTGEVVKVTVTAVKDAWLFEPEEIEVNRGDKVIMTVVNKDSYDHGIAIDALGVSQRMPANETIVVEFVATQPGEFPFYCSVPCGEGEYKGTKRTHFDMIGRIKVRDIIKEDTNPLPNQ
ncbi:MAG: Uncharacterized protein G01um101420_346 [Parcubacteria group bacterium Gr01-1014_20]|nr:MAG: Uncharacterized protein G01um101420_346 [Parcubacteria group bacterium Gr01-1014_20]